MLANHTVDNAAIVARLNSRDLLQHCFCTADRSGIAAAVEFPRLVRIGVRKEQQVTSPCFPVERRTTTIIPFMHREYTFDVTSNHSVRMQTVFVRRHTFRVILIDDTLDLHEGGFDRDLACKKFCTN